MIIADVSRAVTLRKKDEDPVMYVQLDLSSSSTKEELAALTELKQLTSLTLGCQTVKDAALAGVSALTNLRTAEVGKILHHPFDKLASPTFLQIWCVDP